MMYSEYEIFGTNQQMRKVIEQACERLMETYGLAPCGAGYPLSDFP